MDEAIHFDLPEQPQRINLLQLYLDKYIVKAGTAEVGHGPGGLLCVVTGLPSAALCPTTVQFCHQGDVGGYLVTCRFCLEVVVMPGCLMQGEAGSGKSTGVGHRLSMMLRGRKLSADRISVDPGVNEQLLRSAAERMEGFSGREIAKFMASVQAAVYGSASTVLTPEIFK